MAKQISRTLGLRGNLPRKSLLKSMMGKTFLFSVLFTTFIFLWASCALFEYRRSAFLKALWVTRWDFKDEEGLTKIVKGAALTGFDHIMLQVRGAGEVLYKSDLEPMVGSFNSKKGGFDPLATAIKWGRAMGVGIHAWVNVATGWRGKRPPESKKHIFYTHPEWFLTGRDGKRSPLSAKRYQCLNLCLPAVREHIASICEEIVKRYKVSGVHLDYIRFLEIDPGDAPETDRDVWDEWRRSCVNKLVKGVNERLRNIDPGLCFSAAVLADLDRARRIFCQDAAKWAASGWIDRLYFMNYQRTLNKKFSKSTREAIAIGSSDVEIVVGIGAYMHMQRLSHVTTMEQIEDALRSGSDGVALFSAGVLFNNKTGNKLLEKERTSLIGALKRRFSL